MSLHTPPSSRLTDSFLLSPKKQLDATSKLRLWQGLCYEVCFLPSYLPPLLPDLGSASARNKLTLSSA